MSERIMYVCTDCADNNPEGCGHFDRNSLRALPDGKWLCEGCFDELTPAERESDPDADKLKGWRDFPPPRAYAPEQSLEMAKIRIASLDALLRLHKCNADGMRTVGECVGENLCGCSCGLLLIEEDDR